MGYPAAFSPDGQVLDTVAVNDRGRLWDLSVPNHPRLVRDLGSTLTTAYVAISPRGHPMATAPADGLIHLWNPTDNQQQRMIGSPPTVTG